MDTINPSQPGNWEGNVYVVSTTRVLMAFGLAFLIRSVYQLFQRMRSAGGNTNAPVTGAEDVIAVDLEALALGTLGDAASFSSEPTIGIDETLEITLPQPSYSPQSRSSQRPVSSH